MKTKLFIITLAFALYDGSTNYTYAQSQSAETPNKELCVAAAKTWAGINTSGKSIGDTVTKDSPRTVRKAYTGFLAELFEADIINYVTYCYYVDEFGFRPKKQSAMKNKKNKF